MSLEAFFDTGILVVWPSLVVGIREDGAVIFEASWLIARVWLVLGGKR